ncbi:lipopolysaccharide biosynthesis protein [Limnohabitans sp. DM1]|uniref:lipopolysaccharide biosynthesis protein n=1 Tax=Limnohabitans sp. DM1 TaxID=1597955 RepID=UPI000B037C85|nr:oligosaccharide flippase family protein [Limnohabitans sp. DM1]
MVALYNKKAEHLLYAALMFGGMALSFGKWIVFSKVLLPGDFGMYSAVMSSVAVGAYVGAAGLNEYLIQRGSSSHGQGQMVEIYKLRDHSMSVGLLMTGMLLVPLIAVSYLMNWWGLGWANFGVLCALLVSTVVFGMVDASLRAAQRALAFAGMVFFRAVMLLSTGYVLAQWGDFSGILLAELASSGAAIAMALWVWGPGPRLKGFVFDPAIIFALLNDSFSFLKLQLLRYLSLMLDKWLVAWFLGALALGQYSFLLITFLAFTAFAGVYNAVIIPRLISAFSRKNDPEGLANITRMQAYFFLIGSLIIGPFYLLALNKVIYRYFSEYLFANHVIALSFIYLGSAFHVSSQFFDSLFYALRKQSDLAMLAALSLLLFGFYYLAAGNILTPSVLWFSFAFFISKFSCFLMTLFRVSQINIPSTNIS